MSMRHRLFIDEAALVEGDDDEEDDEEEDEDDESLPFGDYEGACAELCCSAKKMNYL